MDQLENVIYGSICQVIDDFIIIYVQRNFSHFKIKINFIKDGTLIDVNHCLSFIRQLEPFNTVELQRFRKL